jgi:hypothetical protein
VNVVVTGIVKTYTVDLRFGSDVKIISITGTGGGYSTPGLMNHFNTTLAVGLEDAAAGMVFESAKVFVGGVEISGDRVAYSAATNALGILTISFGPNDDRGNIEIATTSTPAKYSIQVGGGNGIRGVVAGAADNMVTHFNTATKIDLFVNSNARIADVYIVTMAGKILEKGKDWEYIPGSQPWNGQLIIHAAINGQVTINVWTIDPPRPPVIDPFVDIVASWGGTDGKTFMGYVVVGYLEFDGAFVNFGGFRLGGTVGGDDIIIVRFAPSGANGIAVVTGAASFGGATNERLLGVAMNSEGNFVAVGYFTGSTTIDDFSLKASDGAGDIDMLMIEFRFDESKEHGENNDVIINARADGSAGEDMWLGITSVYDGETRQMGMVVVGYIGGVVSDLFANGNDLTASSKDMVIARNI